MSLARARVLLAWTLSLLLLAIYVWLPDRELSPLDDADADASSDTRALEIDAVTPADPYPGGSVVVRYAGDAEPARVHVYAGKSELAIIARHPGAVVAVLPRNASPGDLKIRMAIADELGSDAPPTKRSKAYHVHVKPIRWRKAFRSAVGGFALLVLGIGLVTRASRAAIGFGGARRLSRIAQRRPAALAAGALIGALAQSTTAAAGVLAGMVASDMLAVPAAAIAFSGAQIGAVAALAGLAGIVESHDALVLVALGVLWSAFARDRRGRAVAQIVLGAGIIAFGTQVLRPGLEPLALHPTLLSLGDGLRADGVAGTLRCALLGAGLVALLQGPAPVIVLLIDIAQLTGHFDLRTAVALLAGSGLGAAASALLITPAGPRCRELARLNLVLGVANGLFAALTAGAFTALTQRLGLDVHSAAPVADSRRLAEIGFAFVSTQLTFVLFAVPLVARLARLLTRSSDVPAASDERAMRQALTEALAAQRAALVAGRDLLARGARDAGAIAEHGLVDARTAIESLLRATPRVSLDGEKLGRAALSSLQLQRSLEQLLRAIEELVDSRVGTELPEAASADAATLDQLHELLDAGLQSVASGLATDAACDLEAAREREIRINGIEARARSVRIAPAVLKVVDAYETAGNQVYRLAELSGEVPALDAVDGARA